MNEIEVPALLPALPEIVLAVGAMALLMLGAFRGEHTARLVNWLSILLLVIVAIIVLRLPGGKLVTFGGSFVVDPFARFLKLLAIAGSAAAIFISLNYL
jgi:NADH-quinone oxidoreductase subunit N